MSVRLGWTKTAGDTLEQVYDYLAAMAGEDIASQIETEIVARVEDLLRFPHQSRIVPELARTDVREVMVRSYRVIYRLEPEVAPKLIFVLGIAHPSPLLQNTTILHTLH